MIVLDWRATGSTVSMEVGESFGVRFEESPSSGYMWFYQMHNLDVATCKEMKREPTREPGEPMRYGVMTWRTEVITALSVGTTRFTGRKCRPWDAKDIVATFLLDITVEAASDG